MNAGKTVTCSKAVRSLAALASALGVWAWTANPSAHALAKRELAATPQITRGSAWTIHGRLQRLSSPAAYSGHWTATFPAILQRQISTTRDLTFYLVPGVLVRGHYAYVPQFSADSGTDINAAEVALDAHLHLALFAFGEVVNPPVTNTHAMTLERRSGHTRHVHRPKAQRGAHFRPMTTGTSNVQIDYTWYASNGITQVANVCDAQGYNYDSVANTISAISINHCGQDAQITWSWYVIPGSISKYGPILTNNGSQLAQATTKMGTNASMSWPCTPGDNTCPDGRNPDCQIDYNAAEITGYSSGNQYETGLSEIWSPSGRVDCKLQFTFDINKYSN